MELDGLFLGICLLSGFGMCGVYAMLVDLRYEVFDTSETCEYDHWTATAHYEQRAARIMQDRVIDRMIRFEKEERT